MTTRLITIKKPKLATICLAMIVRDEAHVILRCLNSCKDTVDFVRIIDTGSRDETIGLIRDWAEEHGMDCEVISKTWRNFRDNRNELLDFAANCKATHLLLIDADEILHMNPHHIKLLKTELAKDFNTPAFVIPMLQGKGVSARINLVRNMRSRIQYHFRMHEELWIDGNHYPDSKLIGHPADYYAGPHVTTPADGARSQDPNKVLRDLDLLKQAYEEEPHPRYVFYMAQTLRTLEGAKTDLDAWKMIRDTYERYLAMSEGTETTYRYVAALWAARISEVMGEDSKRIVALYLRAYNMDKLRPEAMGSCAAYCFDMGLNELAEQAASVVASCVGSKNYAFREEQWYQVADALLAKLKGVLV